jgi:peptidoglycan hydrolase CwlO-like protein
MNTPQKPLFTERLTSWIGSVSSLIFHTAAFLGAFILAAIGFATWEMVLLFLTTIVSLEAIYLAILIQMTVNRNTESLQEVEEDIEEIQEDVEELSEDVEDIQEDIEDIQEDVEEMTEEDEKDEVSLDKLTADVKRILEDLEALKQRQ